MQKYFCATNTGVRRPGPVESGAIHNIRGLPGGKLWHSGDAGAGNPGEPRTVRGYSVETNRSTWVLKKAAGIHILKTEAIPWS